MAFVRRRGKYWYGNWRDSAVKPQAKSFGRDRRAAEDFVILKNADRIRGVIEPSQSTFWDWWKRFEVEKLPGLTDKVQDTYRSMARRLLLPYFGSKTLVSIARLHQEGGRAGVDHLGERRTREPRSRVGVHDAPKRGRLGLTVEGRRIGHAR